MNTTVQKNKLTSFRQIKVGQIKFVFTYSLIFCVLFPNLFFAQHTITVRKKEPKTATNIEEKQDDVVEIITKGFYYSSPFTLLSGNPGEPPSDYRRLFCYVDDYDRVYLFHSKLPVKKAYDKFVKSPQKLIEEEGTLEITPDGWLYLDVKTIGSYQHYKYIGEVIKNNLFYLEYKAYINGKTNLDIDLKRYI